MDIYDFLRAQVATHGSVAALARKCDVSKQIVGQWLSDNPRERLTPSPASCRKIAAGLNLELDYVLELAGHREAAGSASPEPRIVMLARQVPDEHREAAETVLAALVASGNPVPPMQRPGVKGRQDAVAKRAKRLINTTATKRKHGDDDPLKVPYRRVGAVLTAGRTRLAA